MVLLRIVCYIIKVLKGTDIKVIVTWISKLQTQIDNQYQIIDNDFQIICNMYISQYCVVQSDQKIDPLTSRDPQPTR